MQSLVAIIEVKKGSEEFGAEVLRGLVTETGREPGVRTYDLHRDERNPEVFVVCERYADNTARATHMGSPYLAAAMKRLAPHFAKEPILRYLENLGSVHAPGASFEGKTIELQVLPLGPVSLVYARTAKGLLACGAIDPAALQRFGIAAARVKPAAGKSSIGSLADLLEGEVREANDGAKALGIQVGQAGTHALRQLL